MYKVHGIISLDDMENNIPTIKRDSTPAEKLAWVKYRLTELEHERISLNMEINNLVGLEKALEARVREQE